MAELTPIEVVARKIRTIRGLKVIIDSDLAELYGVETKVLNQAVRRNLNRFPDDFSFRLTADEFSNLRSQSVTSSWGGRRYPPTVFTEHGALMAANVLRSESAIEMSLFIVRAFVKLRSILSSRIEMLRKLEELEDKVGEHDEALRAIVEALRRLMAPPPGTPKIGFEAAEKTE